MIQAMIFAAGLGTRLKPLTDTMPKAMVRVGGQPLLWHMLKRMECAGVGHVVVNVHHFATQITDYLKQNNQFNMDIVVSDETRQLLETGGGLKKARPLFLPDMPLLIHNVDIFSNAHFPSLLADDPTADAVLLVSERVTKRYLLFDETMRLVGWTNIETGEVRSPYPHLDPKTCRRYAFAGIHVIRHHTLLDEMDAWPEKFGISDFYLRQCATARIIGHLQSDLKLLDVGKLDTIEKAEQFIKENQI